MSVFGALDVSATGMTAQQLRMDTISENIAMAYEKHSRFHFLPPKMP